MERRQSPLTLREIAYTEAGLDYRYSPHSHTAYQWYCVIYGGVDQTVGDQVFSLNPEESLLIPPGAVRSPCARDKAPAYLFAVFENHALQLDVLCGRVLPTPRDLLADLHALARELRAPEANTHELVEALLVRLLVGLGRAVAQEQRANPAYVSTLNVLPQREVVERVEAFMRRNLSRDLSRQELAEMVNLSPAHLARVFQQVTGSTLISRLLELRIALARQLLLTSTLSITEISLQVGYRSFSHFSRAFKESVGVTPSDYRRSGGNTWRK
jgi:AraC-like DNA-binding protein